MRLKQQHKHRNRGLQLRMQIRHVLKCSADWRRLRYRTVKCNLLKRNTKLKTAQWVIQKWHEKEWQRVREFCFWREMTGSKVFAQKILFQTRSRLLTNVDIKTCFLRGNSEQNWKIWVIFEILEWNAFCSRRRTFKVTIQERNACKCDSN
jgi:hypothetical protein